MLFAKPTVLFAKPSVLFAKPSVLFAKPSVLFAKLSVLFAKPSVLFSVLYGKFSISYSSYLPHYRIVNNVNIVIENLILKFVEEDIVLSVNIKTLEIFSVNSDWTRAFVDLTTPELVLRRLIEITDLTVCLDKRDREGKILVYQDPLIYRCSLQTRIHTKYNNLHTAIPNTTKIHTLCKELNISLTDTQLPMFLRLVELALAIYYGELELESQQSSAPSTTLPQGKPT